MNAALALALGTSLIGCELWPTKCQTTYDSAQTHYAGAIASGPDLIAVLWYPGLGVTPPFAAIVSRTGAVSKSVPLPPGFDRDYMLSATGHASAAWLAEVDDGLAAAVLGDDGVISLSISPVVAGISIFTSAVVFDGHDYQLFWLGSDRLQHREVSERGVLGEVHDLGPAPDSDASSIFAVSDRAGAVYLVVAAPSSTRILAIDPITGTAREIWSGEAKEYATAFWQDGEIHLRHDVWTDQIESFDPTTGGWRVRPMPAELDRLPLFPTSTNVYAWDTGTMFELDSSLDVIMKHPVGPGAVGTFGSDWVVNTKLGLDSKTLTPGRVELTRGVARTDDVAWHTDVVVDSEVVVGESCVDDTPAESANPGE